MVGTRRKQRKGKVDASVEDLREIQRRIGTGVQRYQPPGMERWCPATRMDRTWSEDDMEWDLACAHARIGTAEEGRKLRKAQVRV